MDLSVIIVNVNFFILKMKVLVISFVVLVYRKVRFLIRCFFKGVVVVVNFLVFFLMVEDEMR